MVDLVIMLTSISIGLLIQSHAEVQANLRCIREKIESFAYLVTFICISILLTRNFILKLNRSNIDAFSWKIIYYLAAVLVGLFPLTIILQAAMLTIPIVGFLLVWILSAEKHWYLRKEGIYKSRLTLLYKAITTESCSYLFILGAVILKIRAENLLLYYLIFSFLAAVIIGRFT
ncbi:MAG: hypothetical protein DRP09_16870 [Candidatus Thorarchaeota archaeon]|nr:MAG: hypothetical protein DRP09_16870 [Candidatus Thorarchaeota archaeon]